MNKNPLTFSLFAALLVSVLLSFGQDFVIFDYHRPGAVLPQNVWDKFDKSPLRDVKDFIADHSKKQSVLDSIKTILGRYRHSETWHVKAKQSAFYFVVIFFSFIILIFRYRLRGKG